MVGAGSAGCVVAARLSEDPHRQVTLIEAGPDLAADSVPGAISGPSFMAALDEPGRTFETLTATRSGGTVPRNYARGRGVGGSSAVNAMVGLRGDAAIYRRWGWSDVDDAWARVRTPLESPDVDELGPVDRALLAAHARTEMANLTRVRRRRVTAAEAYLWPALERDNLTVRAHAAVATITTDAGAAAGVVLDDGTHLPADRIVLCAGAIHSPWLLQRSALGSADVGTGLQDHPSAPLTLQFRSGVDQDVAGLAIGTLLQHRTPDGALVQLLPMNHLGSSPETAGLGLLMVALMTPHSNAGTVRHEPGASNPTVDFALLDDERDIEPLVAGVRLALELLATSAFHDVVEAVYIDAFGTTTEALVDEQTIASWLRANCGDYVHASSSCGMGRVVDRDGWVYGVEGLAVCDASVFPSIPDVNTHLPTTMLAEMLVARWRDL